jgi:hypothetical protein
MNYYSGMMIAFTLSVLINNLRLTFKENIKMKNLFLTILFLIVFQTTNILAQERNESVTQLVSILKQKVLLSDDQTNSIEKVLKDLFNKSKETENKDSLIQEAQKKVESYLDKKQKMKYDIIKSEWWKQVSSAL